MPDPTLTTPPELPSPSPDWHPTNDPNLADAQLNPNPSLPAEIIPPTPPEEPSLFQELLDFPLQVVAGPVRALESAIDLLSPLLYGPGPELDTELRQAGYPQTTIDPQDPFGGPVAVDPRDGHYALSTHKWIRDPLNTASALGGGFSQFASAMALPSPLKAFNVGQKIQGIRGVAKVNQIIAANKTAKALAWTAKSMSQGAIAEFIAFQPNDGRLADFFADSDIRFVADYAALFETDHTDSQVEGRLKNVLEGMMLGPLFDGLIHGVSRLKMLRKTGTIAENQDEVRQIHQETAEAFKKIQKASEGAPRAYEMRGQLRQTFNQESPEVLDAIATVWENFSIHALDETADESWKRMVSGIEMRGERKGVAAAYSLPQRLIKLYKEGSINDIIHEMGHVARKALPDSQNALLNRYYKFTKADGKPNRAAEEAFAVDWERFIRNGYGPTKEVASIFKKFKMFMRGTNKDLQARNNNLANPELNAWFKEALGGDEPLPMLGKLTMESVDEPTSPIMKAVDPANTPVERPKGYDAATEVRNDAAIPHGSVEQALEYHKVPKDLIKKFMEAYKKSSGNPEDLRGIVNTVTNSLDTVESVKVAQAISELTSPRLDRSKVVTFADVQAAAEELGTDLPSLKKAEGLLMDQTGQSSVFAAVQVVRDARRALIDSVSYKGAQLEAKKAAGGSLDEGDFVDMAWMLSELFRLDTLVKNAGTYFGRGLSFLRIATEARSISNFSEKFRNGNKRALETHEALRNMVGNPDELYELFQKVRTQKDRAATEAVYNAFQVKSKTNTLLTHMLYVGLLSGPKTLVVNHLNGIMMNYLNPFTRAIGGAIAASVSRGEFSAAQWQEAKAGYYQFLGTIGSTGQGAAEFFRTLAKGADEPFRVVRDEGSLSKIDAPDNTIAGGVLGKVQRVTGVFNKIMQASDVGNSLIAQKAAIIGDLMASGIKDARGVADRLLKFNELVNAWSKFDATALVTTLQSKAARGELTRESVDELMWAVGRIPRLQDLLSDPMAMTTWKRVRSILDKHAKDGMDEVDGIIKTMNDQISKIGDEIEWTQKTLEKLHNPDTLLQDALWWSNEATFTTPLREGSAMQALQRAAGKNLFTRMLLPFVKTPTNIIKTYSDFIPGGGVLPYVLFKKVREGIFKYGLEDPSKAAGRFTRERITDIDHKVLARLIGRQVAGVAFGTAVYGLWVNGLVTGYGSTDPDQRANEMQAGYIPLAIRIGDRHYSLSRFAPFGQLIGAFVESFEAAKKFGQGDAASGVEHMLNGFTSTVVDNSFLVSVNNVAQALNDPKSLGKLTVDQFSLFLPASQFFKQATDVITGGQITRRDGSMGSLIWDSFAKRSLGLMDGSPVYDINGQPVVKGNVVNALAIDNSLISQSPATLELAKMSGGLDFEPSNSVHGINLSSLDRDEASFLRAEMSRIALTIKLDGKTFRETMDEVVQSKEYQSTPEFERLNEMYHKDSPRGQEWKRIWAVYKDVALQTFMEQNPEYLDLSYRLKSIRRDVQQGGEATQGHFSVFDQLTQP